MKDHRFHEDDDHELYLLHHRHNHSKKPEVIGIFVVSILMMAFVYIFKLSIKGTDQNKKDLEPFQIKVFILALLELICGFAIFILSVRICRKQQMDNDY